MNTGIAKTVKLKMYIEGIQFPLVSASIHERVNATPMCDANVGANKYAPYLLPGSLMQLFYDTEGVEHLIFEGELASINYQKTASNQHVSLRFLGITNILDHAWIEEIDFSVESIKSKPFRLTVSNVNAFGKNVIIESDTTIQQLQENKEAIKPVNGRSFILSSVGKTNNVLNNLQKILDESANEPNPLQTVFERLIDDATIANPYFNLLNRQLRIKDRIYVFPNERAKELIGRQAFYEFVFQGARNKGPAVSVKTLMAIICEYLGYDWVDLPAPCWVNDQLKSIIIKPKMQFMMPILTNTVYPNNYTAFRYERNFLQEPTRISIKSPPVWLQQAPGKTAAAFFLAVAPNCGVYSKEDRPNAPLQGFTEEEIYRGITPVEEPQLNFLEQVYLDLGSNSNLEHVGEFFQGGQQTIQSAAKGTAFDETNLSKELDVTAKTDYEEEVQAIADRRFFELRSEAKKSSLSTVYSPFRMVGFAGSILNDNFMHTVGVFSSMNTVISSDGQTTQQISLSGPRYYINEQLGFGLEQPPDLRAYYDGRYQPRRIGNELYQDLIQNPVAALNENEASIFLYSRKIIDGDLVNEDIPGVKEQENHLIYRLSLKYAAIGYSSLKNTARYTYAQKHTERQLVTRSNYWNFLPITNKETLTAEANSRNATDITLSNTDNFDGSPFVKERQERVELARTRGPAVNAL